MLGYSPNTSSLLKQCPYSIRAPVIWDRGCLQVHKGDKPSEKIIGGTDRIPKNLSSVLPRLARKLVDSFHRLSIS